MGRPIFSNQFRLSQQTRMSDGPVFGEQITDRLEVWPESHCPGFALRQADVFQSYTV